MRSEESEIKKEGAKGQEEESLFPTGNAQLKPSTEKKEKTHKKNNTHPHPHPQPLPHSQLFGANTLIRRPPLKTVTALEESLVDPYRQTDA